MRKFRFFALLLLVSLVAAGCESMRLNPNSLNTSEVSLQLGYPTLAFDDLSYDPQLDRVIVPAAESGTLALVDPTTNNSQIIEGFSRQTSPENPVVGTTSATIAHGMIFALDKTALKILIIDPAEAKIVGSAPINGSPDYIRYVSATNELWVSEKATGQIEYFSMSSSQPPEIKKQGAITVPNGPEALLIDSSRGLAFTNQPKVGTTAVIQVMTHNIIAEWGNGCSKARGMAIDADRGLLFVACNEGKVVLMDVNSDGAQITSQTYGAGLDFVAYNPQLKHVYLPSATSAVVAIFEVLETPVPTDTPGGPTPTASVDAQAAGSAPAPSFKISLVRLGTADTAQKARCVTFDNHNNIWVCDQLHAQLFKIKDIFPPGS